MLASVQGLELVLVQDRWPMPDREQARAGQDHRGLLRNLPRREQEVQQVRELEFRRLLE
ncbi:MAG: hypothetical protein ACPGJR_02540 [Akkermansiaceae bacterium]